MEEGRSSFTKEELLWITHALEELAPLAWDRNDEEFGEQLESLAERVYRMAQKEENPC